MILAVIMTSLVLAGGLDPVHVNSIPVDPHFAFNKKSCTTCHLTYGKAGQVDDHAFSIDIVENCHGCHSAENLGYSHPVGAVKDSRYRDMDIPDSLPLGRENDLTCGTCHNPHLDGYTTVRCYHDQEPAFILEKDGRSTPYYQSYYLRIQEPDGGWTALCQACHADY
jgi:hypothetical protein